MDCLIYLQNNQMKQELLSLVRVTKLVSSGARMPMLNTKLADRLPNPSKGSYYPDLFILHLFPLLQKSYNSSL